MESPQKRSRFRDSSSAALIVLVVITALMLTFGKGWGAYYTIVAGTTDSLPAGGESESNAGGWQIDGTLNIALGYAFTFTQFPSAVSGTGVVNNAGRFYIGNTPDPTTLESAGTIANTGALTIVGGSGLTNSGTLTSTSILAVESNASLTNSGTITNSGLFANGGSVILTGGTLTQQGTATYSGTGSVVFGGAGTLTNNQTAAMNIAGLAVNNGMTGTINGTGTTSIGTVTLNGGTLTNNGTRAMNITSLAVNNGMTGTINGTGTTTIGTATLNGGTLTNNASGTMTITALTVNNGITATINGSGTTNLGTATVNGSLNWGGTVATLLTGAGTITGNVSSSRRLAPGNSIGTLTIVGNYTFGAGSIYEVEANAAGQSDRLNVTGRATLNGSVAALAESGTYHMNTTYTILNAAGGVTGAFTGATSNLAFLTPSLSYDANNVYLLLARNTTNFVDVADTTNRRSVASALDRGALSSTGDMETVTNALFGLSGSQARSAYDQMGGATHPALTGASLFAFNRYIGMMGSRMGGFIAGGPTLAYTGTPLLASRTDVLRDAGNVMRHADAMPTWGFWAQGYGSTGDRRGADITSRYDYDLAGVVIGFDKKMRDDLLVGASFGYSHTKATINELPESGTVESYNGSLYGTHRNGSFYTSGIAAFGYNRYDTTREIAFGTIARRATGAYGGTSAGGYLETGYVIKTKPLDIIPIAGLQGTYLSRDSFRERNASSISLDADSDRTSSLLSSLGVRFKKDCKVTSGTVTPELSLRWDHEFVNDDYAINASFAGSPISTFTVRGDRPDRDRLGVNAGVLWQTTSNLYLHLSYSGSISGDDTNHGGTAGIKYRW